MSERIDLDELERVLVMCEADKGHNPGMIAVPCETFRALLDAARAEGGAASGLAAGSLGSGSTAPPEAISPPPPPGGVEELVEDCRRMADHVDAVGMEAMDAEVSEQLRQAADALLSLNEECRLSMFTIAEERARAETAERLLGEVVGALALADGRWGQASICLHQAGFGDLGAFLDEMRERCEALSKVSLDGGDRAVSQDSGTSSAPPFANRSHESSAEGAVSPRKPDAACDCPREWRECAPCSSRRTNNATS